MNQNGTTASVGSYLNATGAIEYGMTNDYMFRAVLQKNVKALKGLITHIEMATKEDKENQLDYWQGFSRRLHGRKSR